MPIKHLTNSNAFVVYDMADVSSTGYARRARKVLQRSTRDMARSVSYTYGLYGVKIGGASAGLSYEGDDEREAIRSFEAELKADFDSGHLNLFAGKGIRGDLIGELSNYRHSDYTRATCETVMACARWSLDGDLYKKRIAVEGTPPAYLFDLLADQGAILVETEGTKDEPWLVWEADADVLLVGSLVGAMTHEGADSFGGSTVIGWGPAAVTAKALAVLNRKGVVTIPGFLAASGGLLMGHVHKDMLLQRVEGALNESSECRSGLFVGACEIAEEFLATWRDEALFGRPLA